MKKWPGKRISIGDGAKIDVDVILGYPTDRLITETGLIIGRDAVMRSGTIVYDGTVIGDGLQTGHHVVIREQNEIGDNVSIWANTVIDYGCRIGNKVKLHTNLYVAQNTIIEDDVFVAPGTVFANDKYPNSGYLEGPHIKKGAKVGVNVTLLPGVVIGERAFVGAGSVVTKNVPDGMAVAGNPARVIGTMDDIDAKREPYLQQKKGLSL